MPPKPPNSHHGTTGADVVYATSPSSVPSDNQLDDKVAPRQFRILQDCIDNSEEVSLVPEELFLAGYEEPKMFAEANIDTASTAGLDSMRALVAVAAHEGWTVHHLIVKSAFLNGELTDDVYVPLSPQESLPLGRSGAF